MSDHGDTGMWVGAGGSAAAVLALIKMYGPQVLRFVLRLIMKKAESVHDKPTVIVAAPQWPDNRPASSSTHRAVEKIAVANDRLDRLAEEVDDVKEDMRDMKREMKGLRGDLVTAFHGIRDEIALSRQREERRMEADKQRDATDKQMISVLDRIANALKQRRL